MRKNLSLFKQIKIALGLVITTALLVIFTNVQSFAMFTNINLTKLPQYQADIKIPPFISQTPSQPFQNTHPLPST